MNDKPRKPVTLTGRRSAQRDDEVSTQPRLTMAEIANSPARSPYAARPPGGRRTPSDPNREPGRGERPVRGERPARAERGERGPQGERTPRTYASRDGAGSGRYGGNRPARQPVPYQNTYDDRDSIARAFAQDPELGNRESNNRQPGDREPGNRDSAYREPGNREPGNRERSARPPRQPRRADSKSGSESRGEGGREQTQRRHGRPQRGRGASAFINAESGVDELGNRIAPVAQPSAYDDEDGIGNNAGNSAGNRVDAGLGNVDVEPGNAQPRTENEMAAPAARPRNPRARAPRRPLDIDTEQQPAIAAEDDENGQRRSRLFRMNKQPAPRRGRAGSERFVAATDEQQIDANAIGVDADGRPQNAQRSDEARIYGVNACRAVFTHRPDAIVRMYVAQNRLSPFTDIMKYCAANRRAYHVVPEEELVSASGSEHHEGICMLIRKRNVLGLNEFLAQLPDDQPCQLLVLENVGNPHNLGALLRSAAHFGIDAVLVNTGSPLHSGSTARVAEGGVEHVKLVEYNDVEHLLEALKANFITVVATSSHETTSLYQFDLPKRAAICFGEEQRGLSKTLLDASDARIIIPGSGAVESLNVSVAAGIVMSEILRRRQ